MLSFRTGKSPDLVSALLLKRKCNKDVELHQPHIHRGQFPVSIGLLQQSLEILCFQLGFRRVRNSAALEPQLDF